MELELLLIAISYHWKIYNVLKKKFKIIYTLLGYYFPYLRKNAIFTACNILYHYKIPGFFKMLHAGVLRCNRHFQWDFCGEFPNRRPRNISRRHPLFRTQGSRSNKVTSPRKRSVTLSDALVFDLLCWITGNRVELIFILLSC